MSSIPSWNRMRSSFERSWADSFSATVFLADFELPNHFKQLLHQGRPSRNWLPACLHEVTHHWCFHSPVGNTIAMLQARSRWRAESLSQRFPNSRPLSDFGMEGEGLWDMTEDMLRAEAALALLEPLAEGIALFVEFDDYPGSSSVISIPMRLAYAYFSPSEEIKKAGEVVAEDVNDVLLTLLRNTRLTDGYVRRKMNLLAQPLHCFGSGYLAGYLMVKLLHGIAIKKADAFWDKDLFVSVLRSWIYEDLEMVACLLDPSLTDWVAVGAISEHLQQRIARWVVCDLEGLAAKFDEAGRDGSWDKAQAFMHEQGADPTKAENGESQYVELTQTWTDEAAEEVSESRQFYLRVLQQREWIRLAALVATVRVSKWGMAGAYISLEQLQRLGMARDKAREMTKHFGGFPVFSSGALPGVASGESEGLVEVYVSARTFKLFVIVTRGSEIVHRKFLDQATPEDDARLEEHVPSLAIEDHELQVGQLIEELIEGTVAADVINKTLKGLPELRTAIYVDKAMANVDLDMLESCFDQLWIGGVYRLLDDDFTLLEALARLTLESSFEVSLQELKQLDKILTWDAASSLPKLREIAERTGFSFFLESEEAIASWV
jgi:hypothetical protein